MSATRPSSETTPPLTDEQLIWRAAFCAISRIDLAMRAGRHPRRAANKAFNRLGEIPREVTAGTLHPAIAALELLRVELRLKRLDIQPAAPAAEAAVAVAEVPSGEEWEPGDPILHPYDPNPPVIVPLDIDYTPEDWAAIRKAREARNAG
ncbi:hypothetical protein ABZT49_03165 [Methylobacterium sp. EM32]|uniref:hypothetical protein n=1 Tax=Methylobacterium sp. EM32 TaxID=3163481 RepID=UPI0033ACA534